MREGRHEGRKEGRASRLRQLLIQKFGALPEEYAQRLQTASARQMGIWDGRLLAAPTLEDVFRKT